MGNKRNIRFGSFSTGIDNLFGKIKHTHMELLQSRTGQNVIRLPLFSEEEKLDIFIGEAEVRKLLQNSSVTKMFEGL